MDIGHHRRKWKSLILGATRIVFREVFCLLFFLSTWNQNLFFAFTRENSPVQPLKLESPTKLESPKIGHWGGSNPAVAKGKISRYFGFDDAGFLQRTTKLDNKFGPFMGP